MPLLAQQHAHHLHGQGPSLGAAGELLDHFGIDFDVAVREEFLGLDQRETQTRDLDLLDFSMQPQR